MLPRTSPFCAGSPSTSCEPTPTPHPYGAKSNAPAGTMPSSWKPSAICDSPVLQTQLESLVRSNQVRPPISKDVAGGQIFILRADIVPAHSVALLASAEPPFA